MNDEKLQEGYVWFEHILSSNDPGTVAFESEDIRDYIRLKPQRIAQIAILFATTCADQIGRDKKERFELKRFTYNELVRIFDDAKRGIIDID
tara:strand:+ start:405 stop:680 length:276 start_codon:yes stop_codon:yes gene_type:complete